MRSLSTINADHGVSIAAQLLPMCSLHALKTSDLTRVITTLDRTAGAQRRNDKAKHPMLPPCQCHWDCRRQFPEARRREIHEEYWGHGFDDRRAWARGLLERVDRHNICYYLLKTNQMERTLVCRLFWMTTLGYTTNSRYPQRVLAACQPGSFLPVKSPRGKRRPANYIDR